MPAPLSNALTMVNLCDISYNAAIRITGDVSRYNPNLQVVWGPVEYKPPHAYETASLIYIVKGNIVSQSNGEYTVVIRGTNFESWDSWEREDFAISAPLVKFNTIVSTAPDTALISRGTATGMDYLMNHSNNTSGVSPHVFLKNLGSTVKYLNVTGHSLGGTLTPPYFAFLCDYLFRGSHVPLLNCQPFSFAGLTPGNDAFNRFFLAYIQHGLPWRYVNPLDIAPNCWWSKSNIENIYVPYEGWDIMMRYGIPESTLFNHFFGEAPPDTYVQPSGQYTLPTAFHSRLESPTWLLQAMYQHHSTTYIKLLTPGSAAKAKKKNSKPAKKAKKKATPSENAKKSAPAKKKTKPATAADKKKKAPAKKKLVKKLVKKVLKKKAAAPKAAKKTAAKRRLVKKLVKKVLQKKAAPERKPLKKAAPKKPLKKTVKGGGKKAAKRSGGKKK